MWAPRKLVTAREELTVYLRLTGGESSGTLRSVSGRRPALRRRDLREIDVTRIAAPSSDPRASRDAQESTPRETQLPARPQAPTLAAADQANKLKRAAIRAPARKPNPQGGPAPPPPLSIAPRPRAPSSL